MSWNGWLFRSYISPHLCTLTQYEVPALLKLFTTLHLFMLFTTAFHCCTNIHHVFEIQHCTRVLQVLGLLNLYNIYTMTPLFSECVRYSHANSMIWQPGQAPAMATITWTNTARKTLSTISRMIQTRASHTTRTSTSTAKTKVRQMRYVTIKCQNWQSLLNPLYVHQLVFQHLHLQRDLQIWSKLNCHNPEKHHWQFQRGNWLEI